MPKNGMFSVFLAMQGFVIVFLTFGVLGEQPKDIKSINLDGSPITPHATEAQQLTPLNFVSHQPENIKESMNLAGQNLLNSLNPDMGYLPYWALHVDKDYNFGFGGVGGSHNIGRVWDALLRLENNTEFKMSAEAETGLLASTKRFFDNNDNICWAPLDWDGIYKQFELHSFREDLLALNALAKYRNNEWAVEKGHKMLQTLLKVSREDCTWNLDGFDYYHQVGEKDRFMRFSDPIGSNGRMIEALVYFYQTTKDPLAMELATRFAKWHLKNSVNADGTLNKAPGLDHTHSYLCTLRGLLLYGKLTNQKEYIDAVAATYKITVRGKIIKESGWNSHDFMADGAPEVASAADSAQIALLLSESGYPEFIDDVARIVRCRILPSQITSSPPLKYAGDSNVHPERLILGAYGGMQLEPHAGKQSTTDVTASVLNCLTDIYKRIAVWSETELRINFHFDYDDEYVNIKTKRDHDAEVVINLKSVNEVFVRIPHWVPRQSLKVLVNGETVSPVMKEDFVYVPRTMMPLKVELQYDLPIRQTTEYTSGMEYKLLWRGDEIIGITPNSDFYPLYPTAKEMI